jgi:hypothetical protein
LPARNVYTEVSRTYLELKRVLLGKDCKIVSEEPPNHIIICHGSLRGVSPRNAKKWLIIASTRIIQGQK